MVAAPRFFSHSSSNRTQGAVALAIDSARSIFCSESPTNRDITLAKLRIKRGTPRVPANASAAIVLPQPAIPSIKIPLGISNPNSRAAGVNCSLTSSK